MGRMLQKEFGQEPQSIIIMPLLEGLDGENKMSKSLGNYIGIDESATIMFEKAMSIPDGLIIKYFELVTDIHPDIIERIRKDLEEDNVNPRDVKISLAKEIVELYHGKEEAKLAEDRFRKVFQKGETPDDIKTVEVNSGDFNLANIVLGNKLVPSKKEFRRLVEQGGVKVNGERISNIDEVSLASKFIIQIGKKKFIKVIIS